MVPFTGRTEPYVGVGFRPNAESSKLVPQTCKSGFPVKTVNEMPIGRVIKSSTIPSRTFLEQKGS
jgi:hypothetical protein